MVLTRRAAIAAPMLVALPALAQPGWRPDRTVRLIVPFAPGGATDLTARAVAEAMVGILGGRVVVENLSGAGGNVGAEAAARARPDGHTLLFSTPGPLAINAALYRRLAYDPAAFVPVALVLRVANVVMVHPGLPARDLAGLVTAARAYPGALSFGSAGIGATSHLAGQLLKTMTGAPMEHVPYRGTGPALTDLVAGRIQVLIDGVPAALGQIRAGAVRPLAVTTASRWFALPDLPTVAESGVPGYEASAWAAIVAPPGTPAFIAAALSTAAIAALRAPALATRLHDLGAEPVGGGPADLTAHVAAERAKWQAVVEASGATLDG